MSNFTSKMFSESFSRAFRKMPLREVSVSLWSAGFSLFFLSCMISTFNDCLLLNFSSHCCSNAKTFYFVFGLFIECVWGIFVWWKFGVSFRNFLLLKKHFGVLNSKLSRCNSCCPQPIPCNCAPPQQAPCQQYVPQAQSQCPCAARVHDEKTVTARPLDELELVNFY